MTMKEIFAAFLSVSIAGSLVICLILLLRLVFRKAPKALICLLWALVILRLLLPFEIPASFSLRPDTPVFSGMDTQLFIDTEPLWEEDVPDFIPQRTVKSYPMKQTRTVQIDYVAIAGLIWAVVACGLLLYALISYFRLRHRLQESIRLRTDVFVSSEISTAFLLGYLRPRIYLPNSMEPQAAEMVIAHELAHKKRGDNWLKLMAFICLSLHWFNPLAWVMYLLLCKDVEDACDEQVIRNMDADTRKIYSLALLSCGKPHHLPTVCPVAFGEIGIKKRIINVLNYRKSMLWVCVASVVAIALTATFFMTDPTVKQPPYYDQMTRLLGKPLDAVYTALNIDADDVETKDNLTYGKTPIQVEIEGVSMDLYLVNDRQGNLAGFQYVAIYQGDDKQQAAEDTVKLARSRWKSYGYGYYADQQEDPDLLYRISVDTVKEMYDDPRTNELGNSWDITDQSNQAVKNYLEAYENSLTWAAYVEEEAYRNSRIRFIHTFSAWSDIKDNQPDETIIALRYMTRALQTPGEKDYRSQYYENMTLWEKFVDWLI